MYVKLSKPLKKWACKTLFPLDSFCRREVFLGSNPTDKMYLLGKKSGHLDLGVHSSDLPLQNLARAEIFGLIGLPRSSYFPAVPVFFYPNTQSCRNTS